MQHRRARGNLLAALVHRLLFLVFLAAFVVLCAQHVRADAWSEVLVEPRAEMMLNSPELSERVRAIRLLEQYADARSATRILAGRVGRSAFTEERVAIIRALARMGRQESVAALVEARQRVRDPELLFALASFATDDAIRELVAALADPPSAATARQALLRVGSRAVPRLIRALRDPILSRPAMEVLGGLGDRRATWPILALLESVNPRDREAAVDALASLRDDRAAPALLQHREDSDSLVRRRILRALGELGIRDARPLFETAVRSDDAELAAVALTAWVKSDPSSAYPECLRILADASAPLHALARTLLLEQPSAEIVAGLEQAAAEASTRADIAFALARVSGGHGIDALVRLLDAHADAEVYLATAVAVRTAADSVSSASRDLALDALLRHRNSVPTMLSLVSRALAREPSVGRHLARELGSSDPTRRAHAALGLEYLGDVSFRHALVRSLANETDGEAFRREASAVLSLGGGMDVSSVLPHLHDEETGPEAMLLWAASADSSTEHERRHLRERMRAALRSPVARMRAAAARALAITHDVDAWGALTSCLDDLDPVVRIACGRSLLSLPISDRARSAVRGILRTESDDRVHAILKEVADGMHTARHDTVMQGTLVLITRLVDNAEGARTRPVASIEIPDGRSLRIEPLPGGFVVVPDLVSGTADLQRVLGAARVP